MNQSFGGGAGVVALQHSLRDINDNSSGTPSKPVMIAVSILLIVICIGVAIFLGGIVK